MNKRNGFILGLLFIVLVVEIVVLAPKELGLNPGDDIPEKTAPSDPNASGQVMSDVHLVVAKNKGKEWELKADRAIKPKESEQWVIESVKVKFFANDGVIYNVTGQKGEVVPVKNDMRIHGNVETRSSNGYVMKTDQAFYESKSRRLTSPSEVEMIGPKDKNGHRLYVTGADMMSDFNSNEITINRNVHARKQINSTDQVERVATIQSQRALFSGRTNMARFFGNVVIDVDTMQVSGPEASFAYDPKTGNLDSVKIFGGVRVTDTDKYATSGVVNIYFKEKRVEFTGAPRVVQNGDELIGDKIVLLDGGKKVQVLNVKAQIDPKSMDNKTGSKQ